MRYLTLTLGAVALGLLIFCEPAWANQHGQVTPTWRIWWDGIWRILNFLVLAFLIFKVAKQPLADFLKNQKASVAADIEQMEKAKAEAITERRKWEAKTAGLAAEVEDYEKALSDVAAKERDEVLAHAEREARMVLERAEVWADQALRAARHRLASEMLEEAGEIAAGKLRAAINNDDRKRMFEEFTRDIAQV